METTSFSTSSQVPQLIRVQNSDDKNQADKNIDAKTSEAGNKTVNTASIYIPYRITGGAKHPGLIVETPGLANVAPSPVTYRPNLPKGLIENSLISAFQFERIIYAGQAHEQRLPNGARAGISIGDGTGTGKTSTLAGIILDNWFCGRRKTVWFSVKTDLIEAVREEFERLGFKIPIKLINEFTPEQNILMSEGIIFCTYRSLIAKSKTGTRRIDQIMRWLGQQGFEIFDEGHRAKNAFATENGKATQTGQAVIEIQDPNKYPDIRVVYSSATAASEVRHLAYQIRLGIWGDDLKQMIADGNFRADLYDRLNILNLETVPLRFQKEKIRDLLIQGLEKEQSAIGRKVSFEISEQAFTVLKNYDWYGNYREILNFATRPAVGCLDEDIISEKAVKQILSERISNSVSLEQSDSTHNFQSSSDNVVTVAFDSKNNDLKDIYLIAAGNVISHVLSENDNNLRRAASKMGTTHSTLSRIMKKFKAKQTKTQQFAVAA